MVKRVLMFIQICGVASLLFFPAQTFAACDLLADGSFEAGTPNPFWAETSTKYGTPLYDTSHDVVNVARTGNWCAWFGGFFPEVSGSLTQGVLIPADSLPRLNFYLWNQATSSTGVGVDFLRVTVDGGQVFNMLAGNPLYTGGYTLVDLDLSPYADGGCHTLSFQGTTFASSSITNIFVDDVAIVHCSATVRVGATPYASVQAAVDAAGDGSEISATAHHFMGDLLFSQTGRVTFKGGYDCAFSQNPGYTKINGTVTVSGPGTLIVENVVIS